MPCEGTKFKHDRKMKNGMSMCQEITIVKIFCEDIIMQFSKGDINNKTLSKM